MRAFLVTGGAGFIGSHLVHALVQRGHRVRVLDDLSTGTRANLAAVADDVEVIEGDIRDPDMCARACEGVEVVYHEAAMPSVPQSVADPRRAHEVNVNGTFNVLMAARDAGARRVVFAASCAVYGDSGREREREDQPTQPMSPYASTKLIGEQYLQGFYTTYGLETVSLRYFNVFGSRQDPNSPYSAAIPAFVTMMLRGQAPTIFGDGEQTRDFVHISNIVRANLLAAEAEALHGEVVNIGCGRRVSINQVIAAINHGLGTSITPSYADPRAGDIRHSLANIDRAASVLGYTPELHFEAGLEQAIGWYRDNPRA